MPSNINLRFTADIVRPVSIANALEREIIIGNLHRITHIHSYITFNAVILAKGNAPNCHSNTQMRQDHAPVGAGQFRDTL